MKQGRDERIAGIVLGRYAQPPGDRLASEVAVELHVPESAIGRAVWAPGGEAGMGGWRGPGRGDLPSRRGTAARARAGESSMCRSPRSDGRGGRRKWVETMPIRWPAGSTRGVDWTPRNPEAAAMS